VIIESKLFWVLLFCGVFLVYALFLVFSRWCLNSPAVPDEKLKLLHVGMNRQDVERLLGRPRRLITHKRDPEWRYGHRLKRHVLIVRFGHDGTVHQFVHTIHNDLDQREPT
jgi:outer membrane protein assembly factor BamE (lipoprotein component of BamABCDE complex)